MREGEGGRCGAPSEHGESNGELSIDIPWEVKEQLTHLARCCSSGLCHRPPNLAQSCQVCLPVASPRSSGRSESKGPFARCLVVLSLILCSLRNNWKRQTFFGLNNTLMFCIVKVMISLEPHECEMESRTLWKIAPPQLYCWEHKMHPGWLPPPHSCPALPLK